MARNSENPDYFLALVLQSEYDKETGVSPTKRIAGQKRNGPSIQGNDYGISPAKKYQSKSIIDPQLEVQDPTPDIYSLFMKFNKTFFWSTLNTVEVRWSPRMYSCAGICAYERRQGYCSIRLSEPLLKLRPRSDLVETLLHEMIHAYLFLTNNNRDRDGHGPEFQKHMNRINAAAGTNISIYHSFHEEVKLYQQHWWRCDGPCRNRAPFFGMVKRSMNRNPGPNDFWWATHQATCGGKFIKVREPDRKDKKVKGKSGNRIKTPDIRNFFNNGSPEKVKTLNDLKKGSVSSGGAIKKIPASSTTSGKGNHGQPVVNRVVGFNDLSNVNKKNSRTNIFGGEGKKLGSGIPKGKYTGGIAVMNKGTSTLTVKPKITNKTGSKVKSETTKPSGTFVPFGGSGQKLGDSGNGNGLMNVNFKPISPLVSRILDQIDINGKTNKISPEKHKNDFLSASVSDDELAEVDERKVSKNGDNVIPKKIQYTPEKYKDDFLSITISDDELAEIVEPNKLLNVTKKTDKFSPEKYKDEFLDKSSSDDDLSILDINDSAGDNDIVPCPVCNLKIHRDDMSIHLQSCDILNSTIESMSNAALLDGDSDVFSENDCNKNDDKLPQPSDGLLPCPCCSKYVNENSINGHLDECLSLLAIKEFEKEF